MINVVVPKSTYAPIHPKTQEMLLGMDKGMFSLKITAGLYIYQNRNHSIFPEEYTHHLFIDTDVYTPIFDTYLFKMLDYQTPVISAAYRTKVNDECWCAGIGNQYLSTDTEGVCSVDWVGAGFLLVESSVFMNLDQPYFRHITENGDQTGEDIGFCRELKNNGYDIFIDTELELEHYSCTI